MATKIIAPYSMFTDLSGNPLENGYIYIGEINKNPETSPINIYSNDGLTIPLSQPVRTLGGYAVINGSPTNIFSNSDFSITVRDKNGALVTTAPDSASFSFYSQSETDSLLSLKSRLWQNQSVTINLVLDADYTLTDDENTYGRIVITDTTPVLTASRQIIVSNTERNLIVQNDTGQTLTIKTELGTGIEVPSTAGLNKAWLVCDGTDIVKSSNADDSIANIINFGAVGDGTTDDLSAINTAIDMSGAIYIPNGTYRASALPNFSSGVTAIGDDATILLDDGASSADNMLFENVSGITIKGKTVSSTTLSAITGVTGSSGNWSVTATVADATDIAIGDTVTVKNVLPGIIAPGSIPAARPQRGELRLGFFQMGSLSVTGTTATVSTGGIGTYLAASDLLIIKGQIRRIVSITSDTTFTISAALANDMVGLQYWYYLDNLPAGTISTSGTTVTVSGDYFNTYSNVGDLIAVADAGIRKIVSIDSGTQITVDKALPTVASKAWGIVTFGELHEGAWEVTNVVGTAVTWTNKSVADLPTKNVTFGDVIKPMTQLTFTGSAISLKSGIIDIEDIALRGSAAGYGVDLSETAASTRKGAVRVNGNTSITNFSYGAWLNNGSSLFAQEAVFSANTARGVNCTEGGVAWLQGATINGNTGIGVFVGSGSYCRLSDARANGNSAQGVRMEVGGSTWMDFGYAIGNGADGILVVGGAEAHVIGCRLIKNIGDGIEGQNGMYGRGTGMIAISNGNANIRITTGQMELNQSNSIAGASYGAVITGGHCKFNEAGMEGSPSGLLLLETARVNGNTLDVTYNTFGINSQNESVFFGSGVGIASNTTDAYVVTGGKINLESASALPTSNVTLNTMTSTFAYVADY